MGRTHGALAIGSAVALAFAWSAGCGSDDTTHTDIVEQGPPVDSGADVAVDSGARDTGPPPPFPAFAPEMPEVVNNGGLTLAAPKIVTVTWASDPNSAALQDFDDRIGASQYWKKAVADYGIGAATSNASLHVVVPSDPPSPWDENAMEQWLVAQIAGAPDAGTTWPQPDKQTMYLLYIPAAIELTSGGKDACNSHYGYHTEELVGANPNVAVAFVIERCHDQNVSILDSATETGSHEIAEAATDPYPDNSYAWGGFDAPHLAWEMWQGWADEVADACQYYADANYKEGSGLPYFVQQIWSNSAAKAGHDPCVPAPKDPYFNTTPLGLDAVSVSTQAADGTMQSFATKGWRVAPGKSRDVSVGFYSDAPTQGWALSAVEGDGFATPKNPVLALSLSQSNGQNGDVATLSIKVNGAPAKGTAALMTLVSTRGQTTHYMPVVVGAY